MTDVLTVALAVGLLSIAAWIGCGVVSAVIARRRGASAYSWVALGFLLGPVGLFLVLKVLAHACPACSAPVLRAVRQCPNCGDDIPRLEYNPVGPFWTYRRDW